MLVEKLICNARLNLLILHPLPAPSKLPRQTEEPNGLSVPRCQEIKISICEWGVEGGWKAKREQECRLHMSTLAGSRYRMFSLAFPWWSPPSSLSEALSTCIIRPFISRQTKHVIPGPYQLDTAHTSIHGRKGPTDKVKLAEGCERGKGRGEGIR